MSCIDKLPVIVRGTTPTVTFNIEVDLTTATAMYVTFAQSGTVKVTKELSDCTITPTSVAVTLTQADTLSFSQEYAPLGNQLSAQIRAKLSDGTALALWPPERAIVGDIYKEGVI